LGWRANLISKTISANTIASKVTAAYNAVKTAFSMPNFAYVAV